MTSSNLYQRFFSLTNSLFSSAELKQYLKYVSTLKYTEKPDYNKLRKLLRSGLGKKGDEWTLNLDVKSVQQKPVEQKVRIKQQRM